MARADSDNVLDATPDTPAARVDPRIICYHDPWDDVADDYRQFRAALAAGGQGIPRVLLFASAKSGEGKSVTLLNLAVITCRDRAARVLVVDCDLRDPNTHELLDLPREPGLTDVLTQSAGATLDGCLLSTAVEGLTFLPAGQPVANPTELLGEPAMAELISEVRGRYDIVLLEAAPVLAGLDARVLAPLADGVVLVVQAWKTPLRDVDRGTKMLDNANILGFLLNRAEVPKRI